MKNILLSVLFLSVFSFCYGQSSSYELKENISYAPANADEYRSDRCKIDFYFPKNKKDFVTVIWFHGGGLTGGNKEIPTYLKEQGVAVVGVGYRLSPKAKVEDIIQDAALAVKWTFDHIQEYGGSRDKIVLSGHSAGGYLDLMLALNKRYLQQVNLSPTDLMAVVPFSSQAITHFTERDQRGISVNQPIVDEYAPLFWVNKDTAPITLITGDRELEMVGRYEENAYLLRMLKIVGHPDVKLFEMAGYDHGMTYPAFPLLINEINRLNK